VRGSLRWRLVVGIVALMACGLAIADIAGVVLLRTYLMDRVDQQLHGPGNVVTGAAVPGGLGSPPKHWPCTGSRPAGTDDQQLPTSFVITHFDTRGDIRCQLPGGPLSEPPLCAG
jgi:two-component system, OmpR family, sensor kinase